MRKVVTPVFMIMIMTDYYDDDDHDDEEEDDDDDDDYYNYKNDSGSVNKVRLIVRSVFT